MMIYNKNKPTFLKQYSQNLKKKFCNILGKSFLWIKRMTNWEMKWIKLQTNKKKMTTQEFIQFHTNNKPTFRNESQKLFNIW